MSRDRLGWVQKWSDDQQLVLRVVLCIKQKHQSVVCPWNNDQRRVSRMHGSYILDVGARRERGVDKSETKNSSDLGHFILASPRKKAHLHSAWTPPTVAEAGEEKVVQYDGRQ